MSCPKVLAGIVATALAASTVTVVSGVSASAACPPPGSAAALREPAVVHEVLANHDGLEPPSVGKSTASSAAPPKVAAVSSGTIYTLTKTSEAYRAPSASLRVYGDPGTTVSISRGTTNTITGSISTVSEAEAGVIFAKASVSLGISVAKSKSVTTTVGGSYKIPGSASKRGWIELGSMGYDIYWYKDVWNQGTCKYTKVVGKTLKGVSASAWIRHS
jgi:hypothetical protein